MEMKISFRCQEQRLPQKERWIEGRKKTIKIKREMKEGS